MNVELFCMENWKMKSYWLETNDDKIILLLETLFKDIFKWKRFYCVITMVVKLYS